MKDETKNRIRVAAGIGLIGAGAYGLHHADKLDAKLNEIYKARVGGTPDDMGGSMEDKLERLHRRAKGTPEGDAALRKLTAMRHKKTGESIIGRAKKSLDEMFTRIRPKKVVGHLLSARDRLDVITLGNPIYPVSRSIGASVGEMAALRSSNAMRIGIKGAEKEPSGKFLRRLRLRLHPQLIPNSKFVVPLAARDALRSIIELKATDLGYTYPTPGQPDGVTANQAGPSKKSYPTLYINDCETDPDLPVEGEARIQYKLRSKTTRRNDVGKKSYSMDIEIQNIEPIIEEEKEDGESTEGDPAKTDIAAKLDEIRSDLRHENKLSARDRLHDIVTLSEGEAVGDGIRNALKKIMQRNKSAGAGIVTKRVRQGSAYYPRLTRPTRSIPRKGWYPERADMTYRAAFNGIIELERGDRLYRDIPSFPSPTSGRIPMRKGVVASEAAMALKKLRKKAPQFITRGLSARDTLNDIIQFDPRPRNDLGMFTDQEEGPSPNQIDVVYKQPARSIGQNLAGGAVAGVGAALSGTAVKSLLAKVKKAKVVA